jgi:hypothetical protein
MVSQIPIEVSANGQKYRSTMDELSTVKNEIISTGYRQIRWFHNKPTETSQAYEIPPLLSEIANAKMSYPL